MRDEGPTCEDTPLARVLVFDDQPLYRAALVATIEGQPDLALVADTGSPDRAVDHILSLDADLAVIGMNLPQLRGLQVLEALDQPRHAIKLLVLSSRDEPTICRALAAGADGYLTKDADAQAIRTAIAELLAGGSVFSSDLLGLAARRMRADARDRRDLLTERQREILRLTAQGNSAEGVARALAVSTSTVKTHLGHAYEKLGVSTAPAAVFEAMRRGILP
jgi:two-component system, NarL family, nitrate/nitrite response regulator NarL